MAWRDNLQPASFRNVPFKVTVRELEGGRRTARHEFFNRDLPFVEDLGRRAREFTVEAFVRGDDYFAERDALLRACEKKAEGELVLPYDGALLATCRNVSVRESPEEGGLARFSLTFQEAGVVDSPGAQGEPRGAAEGAASDLNDQAAIAALDELDVAQVPEYARTAVETELAAAGRLLQSLDVVGTSAQGVAEFQSDVVRLIDDAADLAITPVDLVAAVQDAVEGIGQAASSALDALFAYRTLFGVSPEVTTFGSSFGEQTTADNAQAVVDLVRRTAVAEAVRTAVGITWDSREQALEVRDAIATELDDLVLRGDVETYQALEDLRAMAVRAIPPNDADLPSIGTITLQESLPAVVLAYELHDDAQRDQELVDRNRVEHPAFMPAGVALEVLVDA